MTKHEIACNGEEECNLKLLFTVQKTPTLPFWKGAAAAE